MPEQEPDLAAVLREVLISPNECDRNQEPANVVDGLFFIGRQLRRLADAVDRLGRAPAARPPDGL